jgi:hypothetical protein
VGGSIERILSINLPYFSSRFAQVWAAGIIWSLIRGGESAQGYLEREQEIRK